MRGRLPLLRLLPLLPLTSCELTEVTVPVGEPVLVVHAVLTPGPSGARHIVVVEESITGTARGGRPPQQIPFDSPELPVQGARVVLTNLDGPDSLRTVELQESEPGVYDALATAPPVGIPLAPGDRVTLLVEAPDGRRVTGTTTIAGGGAVWARVGTDSLAVGGMIELNRDRDTMRIGARPVSGRALQVEARDRSRDPSDDLVIYLFTDSLGVALPGNLINPFEGDSGETVFRAGRFYDLTIAVTDANYYDFLRSGNDPFTGRGFINRLEGGVGVFGSVSPQRAALRVVADVDDPREGVYRLSALDPLLPEQEWALYLDAVDADAFSAFATDSLLPEGSVSGVFRGDTLVAVEGPPRGGTAYRGIRAPGGQPFLLEVFIGDRLVGTVTAIQTGGPGLP